MRIVAEVKQVVRLTYHADQSFDKRASGFAEFPRDKLGLRPGDSLDAKLEGGSIVLTPKQRRRRKVRIVIDPITGLPVLTAGPGAPILTNKQVKEILSDFP